MTLDRNTSQFFSISLGQLPALLPDAIFWEPPMLYRKSTLAILLALIFISFFGTLTLSASMFPQSYDWRYRVISNLLSPRDNPEHYRLAAMGMSLSGVLMLPFAGYLRHRLRNFAPKMATATAAAFLLAIIGLICASFVVPQHSHPTAGIRRLHELLGHFCAGFFAMAMFCGCWCASKVRTQSKSAAWLFWIWLVVTAAPLIGFFGRETLLLSMALEPPWADQIRAMLRDSVFWHLGFWEWTGAAGIFIFLCAAVLFLPACRTMAIRTE
jgi:hypothetical protein